MTSAITTTSVAVAAIGKDGGLVSQRLPDGAMLEHEFPPGVSSFDDVSIDVENESLVFALSVSDRRVCGYSLDATQGALELINCVGDEIPVSPFCGLAAQGGNLIVSGGVGGVTYFRYNPSTGLLAEEPVFQARQMSGVRGFPDVIMLSSTTIAFSTDFSSDPTNQGQFGTLIATIDGDEINAVREFRLQGGRFDNAQKPSNFAFVNARFANNSATYLYTANRIMGAVDPTVEGGTVTLVPSGNARDFEAVTVTVTPAGERVFFGGEDGRILEFNATNPVNLTFTRTWRFNDGRLTSIAASNDFVAIATDGGDEIRRLSISS